MIRKNKRVKAQLWCLPKATIYQLFRYLSHFYSQDQGGQNIQLSECHKCGRSFAADRVAKHEKVCKGPEVKHVKGISEKYDVKSASKPNMKKVDSKPPKWKTQHNELQ